MWTASELYRDKKITAEQLATAFCYQATQQKRLGRIALEKRYLTVAEVMAILAEQAESPTSKFGELAISLGYLSQDALKQLLGEQTLATPSLAGVLLELGYISRQELLRVPDPAYKQPAMLEDDSRKQQLSNQPVCEDLAPLHGATQYATAMSHPDRGDVAPREHPISHCV